MPSLTMPSASSSSTSSTSMLRAPKLGFTASFSRRRPASMDNLSDASTVASRRPRPRSPPMMYGYYVTSTATKPPKPLLKLEKKSKTKPSPIPSNSPPEQEVHYPVEPPERFARRSKKVQQLLGESAPEPDKESGRNLHGSSRTLPEGISFGRKSPVDSRESRSPSPIEFATLPFRSRGKSRNVDRGASHEAQGEQLSATRMRPKERLEGDWNQGDIQEVISKLRLLK
ncbi:hypothetical protein B0H19DRAFT_1234171 [Mycena capillaripes]|nr:hypothetical protein B0H19DRAFT_1234171 [Mycena capillaripes]